MSGIFLRIPNSDKRLEVQYGQRGGSTVASFRGKKNYPLSKLPLTVKQANPHVFSEGRVTHPLLQQARSFARLHAEPSEKQRQRQQQAEVQRLHQDKMREAERLLAEIKALENQLDHLSVFSSSPLPLSEV